MFTDNVQLAVPTVWCLKIINWQLQFGNNYGNVDIELLIVDLNSSFEPELLFFVCKIVYIIVMTLLTIHTCTLFDYTYV